MRDASARAPADTAQLKALTAAVYEPAEAASWPGRSLDWSAPQLDIFLFEETDQLVSYAALVSREGRVDDRPSIIGGVGAVKTHPDARGKGHASALMKEAERIWSDQMVDFALLVCEPGLIDYYSRLGWVEFRGTLLTLQKGKSVPFDFNRVMVLGVCTEPPTTGTIDLMGPPW